MTSLPEDRLQSADSQPSRGRGTKAREAFRTISEVAEDLDLPQHVLRFWESKFSQIRPMKRGGNRRYYRPDDVVLIKAIKKLLHSDGYTIRGVQKLFKEQGLRPTIDIAMGDGETSAVEIGAAIETKSPSMSENSEDQSLSGSSENNSEIVAVLDELKAIRTILNQ